MTLDAAEQRLRQLQSLNEIARIGTEVLPLRPKLQRMTDALARQFGWEFVACVTVDHERGTFVCEAVTSAQPTEVHPGYSRPLGSGVVGEVAAFGRPLLLDDVRTHANYVETMPGVLSELCVPIAYDGRVIALLNLESTRLAEFHDQMPLLSTVAEQIAGAIASARLHEEVQRRASQLHMVSELTRRALQSGELQEVLDRVVTYVQDRLGLAVVAVLLAGEDAPELELAAYAGDVVNVPAGTRVPLGRGVVGRAARDRAVQLVTDVRHDPEYIALNPDVAAELAVPILFQGRLLGVMNLEATSPDVFTPENVIVVRTLADQVAGVIHMASMNQRLADANRLLSDANRQLQDAQDKVLKLAESAPHALADLVGWTRSLAEEIARTVRAETIAAWELRGSEWIPLAGTGVLPPPEAALRAAGRAPMALTDGGDLVIPIVGATGSACGALRVVGRPASWSDRELRLVVGFSHQLGGALEMQRIRGELQATRDANTRRRATAGTAILRVCPECGTCYDEAAARCPLDGAALDAGRLLPILLLGRYRLLRQLAEGGMGTVFEARDQRLDRTVALKVIRPEHFHVAQMRERLEREARVVARIRHPGVIALYDSGELEDGSVFLAMERLEGADLARVLARFGRGRPAQVAELLRQGAAGLAAAHRAGIVHRDIKPANVFLVPHESGFQVRVLDFGLAKSLGADAALTHTGAVLGTPAYMSPEQVQGQPADVRSDVYSFAAVAYEALVGRRAVGGEGLVRVLVDVLGAVIVPPSKVIRSLPRVVDRAFATALAKDPGLRPLDVEAWVASFAGALEAVPDDVPGWPAEALRDDTWSRTLASPTAPALESDPTSL